MNQPALLSSFPLIFRGFILGLILFRIAPCSALGAPPPSPFVALAAKIQGMDTDAGDQFGVAVAISDGLAVVGAYWDDELGNASGAAYVFERNATNSTWVQRKKLIPSDGQADDWFGVSVALSGNLIVVGSALHDHSFLDNAGAAYVFDRHLGGTNNWGERQKIVADDATEEDWFGWSVAIRSHLIVVGAYQAEMLGKASGAVYAFRSNPSGSSLWEQTQKIFAADAVAGAWFGWSITLDQGTLAVGAPLDGATNSGAAYVFTNAAKSEGMFAFQQRLSANDVRSGDQFGWSVAVDHANLAVGARHADNPGETNIGAVYLYARDTASASGWTQRQRVVGSNITGGDAFGEAVSIRGDYLLVGVRLADALGPSSGAAYLFQQSAEPGLGWLEQKEITAPDGASGHRFGESVALGDQTLIVGSFYDETPGFGFAAGAAYLFAYGTMPSLNIARAQNELVIQWEPPMTNWILEATTNLATGSWTEIPSIDASARLNPPPVPQFYRLRR